MKTSTRSRQYREGWLGRKRVYNCRECGNRFQVDTRNTLPEHEIVCDLCREHTHVYTFVDKITGKEEYIRASDVELATLRAKHKNKNLTFKVI